MAPCRQQHSAGGSVALWPTMARLGQGARSLRRRIIACQAPLQHSLTPPFRTSPSPPTLRLPFLQTLCTLLQSCRIPTLSAPLPLIASCCPFLTAQRLCLRPSRLRRSDPSWRASTSFICEARCVHIPPPSPPSPTADLSSLAAHVCDQFDPHFAPPSDHH